MTDSYSIENRKVDPTRRPATRPDGTPDDDNRIETGPTKQAFEEWAAAGLEVPNLSAMRAHRHARLTKAIADRDIGGILMFDPLNIRYATDAPNMQLWNTHNPFRALLLCADGHMVLFEYSGKKFAFLSGFNPLVKEVRGGAGLFYFSSGDKGPEKAGEFAAQIDEIMRAHAGTNRRLAVDKIMIDGYHALVHAGFEVLEGEEITEKTRAIKGAEEIKAMRCSMHSCEMAIAEMEAICKPGLTEDEVWAELHRGNIKRGGEWIETRLLASGPRTNPWFQECGPRVIQNNEIVAFDTDLIGVYGMCTDISRTWFIGDGEPTAEMKRLFRVAHDHIMENMALLKPGVPFKELVFGGHQLPQEFVAGQYSCRMHGVGLCDEWPSIKYPQDFQPGMFDYECEAGMMLCVEACIQTEGGDFAIKLEDQVLVTETGYENLTKYPFDKRLLG
ncbi:MAG TPA: dimethylsulfonioproprionate lyase DddP [Thermohalobaculum sp.]|nr:dimethylsulfonioproprionate lyase DddP [Thermohalobaculum sp.]